MLAGSKRMLSLFEDSELQPSGTQIDRVQSFRYLGVTTDAKWSLKPHISNLLKKLGLSLSLFNRKFHINNRTRLAFYNGLLLPHLDYTTQCGEINPVYIRNGKIAKFSEQICK